MLSKLLTSPGLLASLNGIFLTSGYSNLIPMLADDVSIFNVGGAGGTQLQMGEAVGFSLADDLGHENKYGGTVGIVF